MTNITANEAPGTEYIRTHAIAAGYTQKTLGEALGLKPRRARRMWEGRELILVDGIRATELLKIPTEGIWPARSTATN